MISDPAVATVITWLGALVALLGVAPYCAATLRGQVDPERITWTIWAVPVLVAMVGQIIGAADIGSWLITGAIGLGPALVVVCSFARRGLGWRWDRTNIVCAGVAVVGWAVGFAITTDPLVAVIVAVVVDAAGTVPTLRHCLTKPWAEQYWPYATAAVAAVAALLVIPTPWTWLDALYPAALLVMTLLLCGALRVGRGRVAQPVAVEVTR